MARKSAKEMREEEERMLKELGNKQEKKVPEAALFQNIEEVKHKKNASYDEIKDYFQEKGIGKQGTFYLSPELMKLFRTKVTIEDTKIAEVIRGLLIEHYFTEEELRGIFENSK